MKILLVEDDKYISANIKEYLEQDMMIVDVEHDWDQWCNLAKVRDYNCIILDIMLPHKDGIQICKELRSMWNDTPIIMLTARDTTDDVVKGLWVGADDYLIKPFALVELKMRIHTLLRRSGAQYELDEITVGDLVVNTTTKQVTRAGQNIIITKKQFQILECLMRNHDKVISKQDIVHHVRWINEDRWSDVVRSHMQLIREKIDTPFDTKLIHTVRGMWFIITTDYHDEDS